MIMLAITLATFALGFVLIRLLNNVALAPWRRSAEQHWTTRARLLYPAMASSRLNVILVPLDMALAWHVVYPSLSLICPFTSGLVGAVIGNRAMIRETFPDYSFKTRLIGACVEFVLKTCPYAAVAFAAFSSWNGGYDAGWWVVVGAVALSVLFAIGMEFWILKWLGCLRLADGRIGPIIRGVADRMHVPMRRAWILRSNICQAYARMLTREVVFTEAIVEKLSDVQIAAVGAHELTHLNEPRRVVLTLAITGALFNQLVLLALVIPARNGQFGWGVAFCILACGARALQHRIRQQMELRADAGASAATQIGSVAYAQALEATARLNQSPAVMSRRTRHIHPNLYDRMLSAGVTPNYPGSFSFRLWRKIA